MPIWNTPAPPELSSRQAFSTNLPAQRFYVVEPDRIRGLTFFFSEGRLFGIHVHDSTGSCAVSTYERFTSRRQKGMVWIYVPISEGDNISVLGIRTSSAGLNILIGTSRVGDVIIGPHTTGSVKDRCLGESAPISLIYAEPGEGGAVPYFGAYCKPSFGLCKPFPLRTSGNPLGNDSYFSWAPLEQVSSTLTFHNSAGYCRGIILYYKNGGSRSVGECRIHIDSAQHIIEPHWLCFRAQMHPARRNLHRRTIQVDFRRTLPTGTRDSWTFKPLKGYMIFWFTSESATLELIGKGMSGKQKKR